MKRAIVHGPRNVYIDKELAKILGEFDFEDGKYIGIAERIKYLCIYGSEKVEKMKDRYAEKVIP